MAKATSADNSIAGDFVRTVPNLAKQFELLIKSRCIEPHFHPVVALDTEAIIGFELLARSSIERLRTPAEMFSAAEHLHQAAALSELCRSVGYKDESQLPKEAILFVNVHPSEPLLTGLLPAMRRMREAISRPVVAEIHESAVTDPATLNEFALAARELNVELAFDDFGIGRARLLELASTPPAYVKFDIRLIRNIDERPRHHAVVLRSLVSMVRELGCTTVAEGVESELDAESCRRFGFDLAQGFLFGRPAPAASFNTGG